MPLIKGLSLDPPVNGYVYRSCMAIDVTNQKAVIILSNLSAFHKKTQNIHSICFELAKMMER